jgi:hypothetical protein
LEQSPVSLRESLKEFADLEVIASHGADLRHELLADILGDGLSVHLGGEVITALGRVLMERTLEELQGVVDLAFELFLAEPENLGFFAHKYAYIYAYFRALKSARQEVNVKINAKKCP